MAIKVGAADSNTKLQRPKAKNPGVPEGEGGSSPDQPACLAKPTYLPDLIHPPPSSLHECEKRRGEREQNRKFICSFDAMREDKEIVSFQTRECP